MPAPHCRSRSVGGAWGGNAGLLWRTMVSRQRPSVFVWVYNLKHRLAKDANSARDMIGRFNTKRGLAAEMQLSKKETTIVMNLAFYSAESFVDKLIRYHLKQKACPHLFARLDVPSNKAWLVSNTCQGLGQVEQHLGHH